MKKLVLFFVMMVSIKIISAQTTSMACCASASATEKFASFASDKKFLMSHDAPLPFNYKSENGKDITYTAADGTDAHGWMVKATNPTSYYLFVIHEYWGLNDYVKQETERLSKELGVNAIAIDLYDNKVASTPDSAGKLMQSVKTE